MAAILDLTGKKGLIVGIASEHSIAYGCAHIFHQAGVQLAITYLNDKAEPYTSAAHEAIELYCTLAAKEIAAMLPALGGLDALVFTGGIGKNAPAIRDKIISLLQWVGDFSVLIIPTDEEFVMANACKSNTSEQMKKALLQWENEGGKAAKGPIQRTLESDVVIRTSNPSEIGRG